MAKIGDTIRILELAKNQDGTSDPSESRYIGKEGVVNYVDDTGTIWGTWGGIGLLPEDRYEIVREADVSLS